MTTQPRSPIVVPVIGAVLALAGVAAIAFAVAGGRPPTSAPSSSALPIALAGDAASSAPSGGPGATSSLAVASSDPSSSPSALPSAVPSAPPAPSAAPTPAPIAAGWSKPLAVKGLETCSAIVVAIDDRGTDHLAATCGNAATEIRYAVATDGRTWKTSVLKPPAGRFELDPQLAFAGNTLYLAYTRVAPVDGGCGSDGLADVGVYYRTRSLPGGAWSQPTRIGVVADHLQSFRVNGSVLHATVTNEKSGKTSYETVTGGTLRRYTIGDAAGWTSLRVGDDGIGRVAYESTHGISFGMVSGGRFSPTRIPDSSNGWDPILTLAPGNAAYVIWNRSFHGIGCVGPGPDPRDGTYYATDESGTWVTSRLTALVGAASLTVDPKTGELHAIVVDGRRIVHFHRLPGADWTHETVVRAMAASTMLRQDQQTGSLFMAYVVYPLDGDPFVDVMGRR